MRFGAFAIRNSTPLPETGLPFPISNDAGAIVFGAILEGPGIITGNRDTFWIMDAPEAPQLIARRLGPSPGLPDGVEFAELADGRLFLNAAGEVGFSAALQRSSFSTFVRGVDGTLRQVFQPGDPAPSPPGAIFRRLFPVGLSDESELGFIGELEVGTGGVTSSNANGIWGPDGSGGLVEVQRRGVPVPAEPPGTFFSRAIVSFAVQNRRGEIAFQANLDLEDGVPGRANTSLFGPTEAGETRIRVRQGEPAPGGPEGATFFTFPGIVPTLNDAGQLAFRASMQGVSAFTDDGVWGPGPDGALTLVAREGDPAAGAPDGVTYGTLADPALNANGHVAFRSQLSPSGAGIFGPDLGGRPVLRFLDGDLLDGSIRGPIEGLQSPVLNDRGQLVAAAALGSPFEITAILYANPTGDRGILVQADQPIEVRPGDVRIVTRLSAGPRLSRSGQLVFRAAFTDGTTGLFRTTVPDFVTKVGIDVRPGVARNPVIPGSRGWVTVAILGSADFDVSHVELESLRFGPAGAPPGHPRDGTLRDVDGDGFLDLLSRYRSDATGLTADDSEACLSGTTLEGLRFEGCDAVTPVPGSRDIADDLREPRAAFSRAA